MLTHEELLVDRDVSIENLENYLKSPMDKRRTSETDEVEDNKIFDMLKRKEIKEDLVD